MRVVRSVVLALFIVLVLLPTTVYCVGYFVVNSSYARSQVQVALDGALPNAQIQFADIEIGARPVEVHLHDMVLGDKAGATVGKVEHLALQYDARHFVTGMRRLDVLHVDGFEVNLIVDAEGRVNAADLFRGADKKPKDPTKDKTPKGGELSDLIVSNGTIRLDGPDWKLRLVGTRCAGRLQSGTAAEVALECEAAGGSVTIPGLDGEPLQLTLGEVRVRSFVAQQRFGRLVIDDARAVIDGQVIELNANVDQPDPATPPVFSFDVKGTLPAKLAALLSEGRLQGAISLQANGSGRADQIEVKIPTVRVEGTLQANGRTLQGLALHDVTVRAEREKATLLGGIGFASYKDERVELAGADMTVAATVELPNAKLTTRLRSAAAGDATAFDAFAFPASANLRLENGSAASGTLDGVKFEEARLAEATLNLVGFKGDLALSGLKARRVARGDVVLDAPQVEGKAALEAGLDGISLALSKLALAVAGPSGQPGTVTVTGTVANKRSGFSMKRSADLKIVVERFPGATVAAVVPTESPGAAELAGLLTGLINGTVQLETAGGDSDAIVPKVEALRVERAGDTVVFSPSDKAPKGDGPVVHDAKRRQLRIGPTNLGYRVERKRKAR